MSKSNRRRVDLCWIAAVYLSAAGLPIAADGQAPEATAHVPGTSSGAEAGTTVATYEDLIDLFHEFRAFSTAESGYDVANVDSGMAARLTELRGFQARLAAMEPGDWPVSEQVDYHLVRGEMNGLEFYLRVMQPWIRDPGFYNLDRAGLTEMPRPPLNGTELDALGARLRAAPAFFRQAKANLGGGELSRVAGDLAVVALRSLEPGQRALAEQLSVIIAAAPALEADALAARRAVADYVDWLRASAPRMSAPAGVGRDNYNWLMKNVYLFPYDWDEIETIVRLEDNRVRSMLRLEQNRNRGVPPLEPVSSQEEYRASVLDALDHIDRFIRDNEIYTVPDYLVDDAYRRERLEATSGPWPERHDYFYVFSHREPVMEETHELVGHHYDVLRQLNGSHPIRNAREHEGPYYQSAARWEGLAFAYEELLMHAGYLDGRSPRGREIVYEQAAFRTVRALSDLHQHAQEWSLMEAMEFSIANAPHGDRLRDTNHLWAELGSTTLRMVGWHAQMVAGKVQFLKLMRDRAEQLGDGFVLRDFMDEFYAAGAIPMALVRWELTGLDDEVRELWP